MPILSDSAQGAHALSTGRACLAVMLRELRPRRVYVPFYTCNTVFQPFVEAGVPMAFYCLDARLRPCDPPPLQDGEYFLWTNYFGVCGAATRELEARYGERLLIDDTHAFFAGRHAGRWSFTSARKFFGVPDGADLFAPHALTLEAPRFNPVWMRRPAQPRLDRPADRIVWANECVLDAAIRRISLVSEGLLRECDFARAARRRRENFAVLHDRLKATNRLAVDIAAADVPFCYPYLPALEIDQAALRKHHLFVSRLWPDVSIRAVDGFAWERHLAKALLPLPVDHRFCVADMRRICAVVEDAQSRLPKTR
jgi:hypothetical protein